MNDKKTILVTGANGQLGKEFWTLADEYPAYKFLFESKDVLSISGNTSSGASSVEEYFDSTHIDYCINCAAYTAVDKAENEKEIAFQDNGIAVGNLAAVCKTHNAQLIHFSSDYVFRGTSTKPYKETDIPDPINVYGESKLRGEIEAVKNNKGAIIIRTSWVYGVHGKNFVQTMLQLMRERDSIKVVSDQFGSPTYAADLAEAVMIILQQLPTPPENKDPVSTIFNYCNAGVTNWYEFALAIKEISNSRCNVNPIPSTQYLTAAKRPQYSVLDTTKIQQTFGLVIPAWRDSLKKCIALLK